MTLPASEWLKSQGLEVLFEYKTGAGVVDLVGVALDADRVKTRLYLGQASPIKSISRLEVLSHVHDRTAIFSSEYFQEAFGGHNTAVKDDLAWLDGKGYLERTASGYRSRNGWWPMFSRIVAVELKLSRIAEAFYQARLRKAFVTESYVGLPLDVAERLYDGDSLAEFVEAGIGLVGIGRSDCRVVLEARVSKPRDGILASRCAEEIWRRPTNRQA